jgi:soluble lytic murein transglycosylase-like protein
VKLCTSPAAGLWLALLLTLLPTVSNASPLTRPTMNQWYAYVKVVAKKYNLDPNLCAALAAGESGIKNQEVRFCWVGKSRKYPDGLYHGPYNLHRCFLDRWDITDWRVNTEVGIRTLAHRLKEYNGNLRSALRHYNTDDKGKKFDGYVANIKRLQRQYKKRRVFVDELRNYALRRQE